MLNETFFHWYLPLCLSEKNAHRPKNPDFSDSSSVLYILSSWFHLLVENCKMMVACPHHPGFLSHNVPITITRLSSRNKSSSENQRWKWNVRKFSQNGLTKNKWKESGNVLSGNTGEEKREARKFKMMMLLLLLTFWTILSSGVECFFKAKKCWSLTKTNCLLITITMGILPPTMDTEFCLHLQLH